MCSDHHGADGTYVWVGVATDDDLNRAGVALAQNCVDVVQRHVTDHCVVNLHNLISTSERWTQKTKETKRER